MKPKLVMALLAMTLAPLAILGWLGARVARYERANVERSFQDLLLARLGDIDSGIMRFLSERERQLAVVTELPSYEPEAFRERVRETPFIRQMFCLGAQGDLLYPSPAGELTQGEREFLQRTRDIWIDKALALKLSEDTQGNPSPPTAARSNSQAPQQQSSAAVAYSNYATQATQKAKPSQAAQQGQAVQQASAPRTDHGWLVWYWGKGMNLLYWRRDGAGRIVGVEVDGVRLMADIIGALPDTAAPVPGASGSAAEPLGGGIALLDSAGGAIYQWGAYEPRGKVMRVSRPLAAPLSSWRLEYIIPRGGDYGGAVLINLLGALAAVGVALIGLAIYFYRESSREMREAAQRVTFVNQVSHELKTPLTNIRMYAELMEGSLADDDEHARKRLDVIVSESQRLSRLIGNILTFSRQQRQKLSLHKTDGVIDDVIRHVLQQFKPSFDSKGIKIEFAANAERPARFDADALEQILGNLFSNVEKYAATGGIMEVASQLDGDHAVITVADHGPGVPRKQRERIFEPFVRLSNDLAEGAAGTGIGLTIARDLARLHGGDLRLAPSRQGARFELNVKIERDGK